MQTIYCMASRLFVLFLVGLLPACGGQRTSAFAVQSLLNESTKKYPQREGVTDASTRQLSAALGNAGVEVVTIGQQYQLVVPASQLFAYLSPNFRWDAYAKLNVVVAYIKQFRTASVRVSAFSHDDSVKTASALSDARAQSVAKYMWRQGIDTRVLYTDPHGQQAQIAKSNGKGVQLVERPAYLTITFSNLLL